MTLALSTGAFATLAAASRVAKASSATDATPNADPQITTFSDPGHHLRRPRDIVAGPDGNMWFTADRPDRAHRRRPWQLTMYSDPAGLVHSPDSIVTGGDGAMWFTSLGVIGRITPSGDITSFPVGHGAAGGPLASRRRRRQRLVHHRRRPRRPDDAHRRGHDFRRPPRRGSSRTNGHGTRRQRLVHDLNGRIGRVTTDGQITTFEGAGAIAFPADSSPAQTATCGSPARPATASGASPPTAPSPRLTAPQRASQRSALTVGADGALWFTNINNRIGRITVDGTITTYDTGNADVRTPFAIAVGADGNLWFTSLANDRLGFVRLPVAGGAGPPGAPAPEYQPFPWELVPPLDPDGSPRSHPGALTTRCATLISLDDSSLGSGERQLRP